MEYEMFPAARNEIAIYHLAVVAEMFSFLLFTLFGIGSS